MVSRITIERILRDDDDASGQTIRQWRIEVEQGRVVIKGGNGDDARYLIGLRVEDIVQFRQDINRAEHLAKSISREDDLAGVSDTEGDGQ